MNKKRIFGVALLVTGALLVITTGVVFARNNFHGMPPFWADDETNYEGRYPYGHMGGSGGHMGYDEEYPLMMSLMIDSIAKKTGLSVEEINSRLADGERLYEIALVAGIPEEEYSQLMTDVRESYFSDALKNGSITEEQYQWMIGHMSDENMPMYDEEDFPCHGFQRGESIDLGQYHRGMGWH